jgi:flagella basal body P-ring formation protein FlgA
MRVGSFGSALLVAALAFGLTAGADAAVLKSRTTIDRDQIELGDLWTGLAPELAETAVLEAPQTGQRMTIDAAQLSALAEANGIDWQPTGHDRTTIERVSLMIDVPVPLHPIEAGDIIRATDLGFQRLRADRVNKTVIAETDHLVGKTAKHAIAAAQPIHAADVGTTLLVTKNSLVSVRLVTGRLNLVIEAKALDDGGEGDSVRVLNQRSNKMLQGVVHGAGTVYVDPVYPVAAN